MRSLGGTPRLLNKKQLIEKQKKSWLIATIVIAICCFAILVGVIEVLEDKKTKTLRDRRILSLFFCAKLLNYKKNMI